jgi:hypothetical protein
MPVFWTLRTRSRQSDTDGATEYFLVAKIRDARADGASGRGAARLCCDPVSDQRNPLQQSRVQRAAGVSGLHGSSVQESEILAAGLRCDAGSRDDRVQYESFVTYFLYACEEAIAAFAGRPEWQASCDYDLKPHLPFLCEKNQAEPAYLTTYGTDTQQWVKASLKNASVTPPDCKLGKT